MEANKEIFIVSGLVSLGLAVWARWTHRTPKVETPVPVKSHTPIKDRFETLWTEVETSVPYNPKWVIPGTGLGLVQTTQPALSLQFGERVRSVDPSGRKIIIIGTRYGNIGFYECHPPQEGVEAVIVRDDGRRMVRTVERLNVLCGKNYNIGFMFEELKTNAT